LDLRGKQEDIIPKRKRFSANAFVFGGERMYVDGFIVKETGNLPIRYVESESDSSLCQVRFSFGTRGWHPYHCRDWNVVVNDDSDIGQSISAIPGEVDSRYEKFFDDDRVRCALQ
jgi:hypothetical protein